MKTNEKIIQAAGNTSGFLSFLGSYNVCHNLCMATIAALSAIGITFSSLPFLFLQDYAIYFWIMAVIALSVSLFLYVKMKHLASSKNMLIANTGFVIAGLPFKELRDYQFALYAIGALLVVYAAAGFIMQKFKKEK